MSLDRARVYRALAQLFRTPDGEWVRELRERNLPELCEALERLVGKSVRDKWPDATEGSDLPQKARALRKLFDNTEAERLLYHNCPPMTL